MIIFIFFFLNPNIFCFPETEKSALELIKFQFDTIENVARNHDHEGKKRLIDRMPAMPSRWEEIFSAENYSILYAMTDVNTQNIHGIVDLLMEKEEYKPRKRRMLVNVKLVKDPISRTGYSMTMENSDPGHTDPPILNRLIN